MVEISFKSSMLLKIILGEHYIFENKDFTTLKTHTKEKAPLTKL